ncbi:hypothetical protein D9758_015644 [Tetrapyrgos nigripes]|uniref:Uncharacterized protein n=1 Tax=Tetrapyrgos nigripes TaxID=182062 RepID=A0A8H5CKL9_9AGAR|nr:hypothetical protein D9758_015644 [Tetrapyrgos nigripes]
MDASDLMLIAQLALNDLDTLRKPHGLEPTDQEIAFQFQAEECSYIVDSLRVALSLQGAMERDIVVIERIRVIDQGIVDDRRSAEALSRGEQLPQMSDAQQSLEELRIEDESEVRQEYDDPSEYVSEPGTPVLRPQDNAHAAR